MHPFSSKPSAFFFLALLRGAFSQICDTNTCETDYVNNGPQLGFSCFVDPSDPAYLASVIEVCPCDPEKPVYGDLIYTGINGFITTALPVTTVYLTTQYLYQTITQEYNVPLTGILPGSPVTLSFSIGNPVDAEGVYSYTQLQSQSIFYTGIVTTIVSTIDVQTTTTQTATEIDVTVLPASTTISRCTTGIQTFTAKPVTKTSTVTSTPVPRTIHKNIVSTTTTTLSCIPGATSKPKVRRSPLEEIWEKRQVVAQYEIPRCQNTPVSTINIVTSTTVTTSQVTSTDTSTLFTTVTRSMASQPPPVTVCSNVKGSTTITPTNTKTSTIRLNRSTVSSITSVTVTKTIVPKHLGICSTPGAVVAAYGHVTMSLS